MVFCSLFGLIMSFDTQNFNFDVVHLFFSLLPVFFKLYLSHTLLIYITIQRLLKGHLFDLVLALSLPTQLQAVIWNSSALKSNGKISTKG